MVGEDNISLRNRRATYSTAEEKDGLPSRLEEDWPFSKSSNGFTRMSTNGKGLWQLYFEMSGRYQTAN